jgi:hypothetical protein
VFSALRGARMGPAATLRVVVAAVTVNITILASLSPITGFFTLTTESYPFIKLLNILFFVIAGFIGLKFLSSLLGKLEQATRPAPSLPPPPRETFVPDARASTLPPPSFPVAAPAIPPAPSFQPAKSEETAVYSHGAFRIWLIMYALVGAQMAWVLRPFIGTPDRPFEIFRERQANFFIDALKTLGSLFN